MKSNFLAGLSIGICMLVLAGMAHASLITVEDFEGGASGWSNNLTKNGVSTFT